MKYLALSLTFIAVILLSSCSNKTAEYLSMGDQAYTANNYELALMNWEKIISSSESKSKNVDPSIYAKAGIAAINLDKTDKAKGYLTQAYNKGVQTPEVLSQLAAVYKKSDNLSYEITYLEQLVKENSDAVEIDAYNDLLFDAYIRSQNWDKASALWETLSETSQKDLKNLSNWLSVQKALKNTDNILRISQQILKKDPNNTEALEVRAKHYYHKAEALYQREMTAYNTKKTRTQYIKLLKALKLATSDFKIARDDFESLYNSTKDKQYAQFLSNIYARLSNKQQSNYYKKLSI